MDNKISLKIVNFYYGMACNLSCQGCFTGSNIIRQLEYFKATEGLPIPECDVCPDSRVIGISLIPRTKENVLPRK